MRSFISLLKREWLEHGQAFMWSSTSVLMLMLLAGLVFVPGAADTELSMSNVDQAEVISRLAQQSDGQLSAGQIVTAMFLDVAGSTDQELHARMAVLMRSLSIPFYWVLVFISIFTLVSCLYDERKDRSVLFWKSMPVTDSITVAAKMVFVTWCMPLFTMAFVLVAQLLAVTLIASFVEEGMAGRVWGNSDLLTGLLPLVFGFLLQGLVLFPLYAWFMLISSWASGWPLAWGLGLPLILVVVERILTSDSALSSAIGWHLSRQAMPGVRVDGEFPELNLDVPSVAEQLSVLGEPHLWGGVVVGLVFLVGAYYFRGRNTAL